MTNKPEMVSVPRELLRLEIVDSGFPGTVPFLSELSTYAEHVRSVVDDKDS